MRETEDFLQFVVLAADRHGEVAHVVVVGQWTFTFNILSITQLIHGRMLPRAMICQA